MNMLSASCRHFAEFAKAPGIIRSPVILLDTAHWMRLSVERWAEQHFLLDLLPNPPELPELVFENDS